MMLISFEKKKQAALPFVVCADACQTNSSYTPSVQNIDLVQTQVS